jgi:hypothetical protein
LLGRPIATTCIQGVLRLPGRRLEPGALVLLGNGERLLVGSVARATSPPAAARRRFGACGGHSISPRASGTPVLDRAVAVERPSSLAVGDWLEARRTIIVLFHAALLAFDALTSDLFDRELARRATLLLAVFPTTYVCSMIYPESLVLLASALTTPR